MKENFIETISIASRPYIFRYELTSNNTYSVTVLNYREVIPFEMIAEGEKWVVKNTEASDIIAAEQALSNAIHANNPTQPAMV